ncbi:uncharacterized protein [Porites lutea]|uniref:uncharacterized protein n=1 Tax=Porites lutea TaxID=51062 RepID=UPI003CC63C0E
MYLAKPYLLIALVLWLLRFETEGQKACSCYTFEGEMTDKMLNWKKANESCEATNKHLVVMETEREWRFITDEIGKLDTRYNEWHIGLFNASGNWTWINGKPLTLSKWQKNDQVEEPDPEDLYGLIHKDFPPGSYGTFSSDTGVIQRDYICEQETDNCDKTGNKSVCMRHYNVTKPTKTPQTRTTSPHEFTTTETDSTSSANQPPVPAYSNPRLGYEDKYDTMVVVATTLAALLFIALIALAVVLFLWRKTRQSNDARDKTAERIELEIQNTSLLNPAQDAHRRQTGVSDENDEEGCEDEIVQPGGMACGYATLHHLSRTPGDGLYTSLTSCDSANSGRGPSNDSPIYVNQAPSSEYVNG